MTQHANSYLLLFSHPYLVESLLRGFIPGDWVQALDFGSLEKVSSSYATDDLRSRHDDLVWRVQLRDGGHWIYIYLLMEFQSTDERFMAVRIMTYQGLLYQDLIRQTELGRGDLLPQVLPIVLYNGHARWRSPTNIADLILQGPSGLDPFRPRLAYLLLDEGALLARARELTNNPVASLFRLEHTEIPEALAVVHELRKSLEESKHRDLRRAFTVWYEGVLKRREKNVELPELRDLEDIETMLTEQAPSWTEAAERKGEAKMLMRQLESRFGAPDAELRRRIKDADSDRLLEWGDRILTAQRVEDVFAD